MFEKDDISQYYDNTKVHYDRWWDLKKNLAIHYGIWDESTKTFGESLLNTNKVMMNLANISEADVVLDAGCGVGGSAMFINNMTNATVTGISLNQNQIDFANKVSSQNNKADKVQFYKMDYCDTTFPSQSFDVIWACESMCHAPNKLDFITECFRLLKRGGRLVIADYFLIDENQVDKNNWIEKWKATWAMQNFVTIDSFVNNLVRVGFQNIAHKDYTEKIMKSAKRMCLASLYGAIPSEIYNLFHPNVTRFAKTHYKSGYYQYKALKENLWMYNVLVAEK